MNKLYGTSTCVTCGAMVTISISNEGTGCYMDETGKAPHECKVVKKLTLDERIENWILQSVVEAAPNVFAVTPTGNNPPSALVRDLIADRRRLREALHDATVYNDRYKTALIIAKKELSWRTVDEIEAIINPTQVEISTINPTEEGKE